MQPYRADPSKPVEGDRRSSESRVDFGSIQWWYTEDGDKEENEKQDDDKQENDIEDV